MIHDMDQLISTDQTSFFKGRFIEEIIRLVYGHMIYTKQKHIQGLLMFKDFEKKF